MMEASVHYAQYVLHPKRSLGKLLQRLLVPSLLIMFPTSLSLDRPCIFLHQRSSSPRLGLLSSLDGQSRKYKDGFDTRFLEGSHVRHDVLFECERAASDSGDVGLLGRGRAEQPPNIDRGIDPEARPFERAQRRLLDETAVLQHICNIRANGLSLSLDCSANCLISGTSLGRLRRTVQLPDRHLEASEHAEGSLLLLSLRCPS